MRDRLMAILSFAVLTLFLGVLVWNVPRLDLGAVVLATLALAGYDFFFFADSAGKRRR